MGSEPFWIPAEAIIQINQDTVAETGEPFQLLSLALLESACAKPFNLWAYSDADDLLTLAVSLMVGISRNHPFAQGNRRTAFQAAQAFLMANGSMINPNYDSADLADALIAVIDRRTDDAALIQYLRPLLSDA